jgi:hypothetical protein
VFEAGWTGGTTIVVRQPDAGGVPGGVASTGAAEDIRIYPLAPEDFAYCGSGWHVISLNIGDSPEFYGNSIRATFAALAAVDRLRTGLRPTRDAADGYQTDDRFVGNLRA